MSSTFTGPVRIRRRAAGQSPGAPSDLLSAELAINFSDNWLYLGFGDDGSGRATSILRIAGFQKFLELAGDQNVAGVKTFLSSPRVPAPASSDDLVTKGYVDGAVSNAGGGDMLRSVYDADNDGVVDVAELARAVEWLNILNRPTEFPPAPHDASLVTSGVFDPSRLPPALFAAPVVSSGHFDALTTEQQSNILGGTHVVTTDGRVWIYKGSGSKTAEASYTELADKTPAWEVIANKPSTLAGYGITDAQPTDPTLTALVNLVTSADKLIYATGVDAFATYDFHSFGRQFVALANAAAGRTLLQLGTLSTQNADNVDITGGRLRNVTVSDAVWDGGEF